MEGTLGSHDWEESGSGWKLEAVVGLEATERRQRRLAESKKHDGTYPVRPGYPESALDPPP